MPENFKKNSPQAQLVSMLISPFVSSVANMKNPAMDVFLINKSLVKEKLRLASSVLQHQQYYACHLYMPKETMVLGEYISLDNELRRLVIELQEFSQVLANRGRFHYLDKQNLIINECELSEAYIVLVEKNFFHELLCVKKHEEALTYLQNLPTDLNYSVTLLTQEEADSLSYCSEPTALVPGKREQQHTFFAVQQMISRKKETSLQVLATLFQSVPFHIWSAFWVAWQYELTSDDEETFRFNF